MARRLAAAAAVALCASFAGALSPADLLADIRRAVAAGAAGYTVPTGVYNYSNATEPFLISGTNNFVLDGGGSVLLFRSGGAGAVQLVDCVSLTVRNLTIDYDPLFFTQGKVQNMKSHGGGWLTYELAVEDGYPGLDDPPFDGWKRGETAKTIFWDAANRSIYHIQVGTTSAVVNTTRLAEGVWGITTHLAAPTAAVGWVPPDGCLGTVSPVTGHALEATNCSGSLLQDVTVWGSGSMGYLEMSGHGGATLRNWRGVRKPGTTRLMATSIDGVHSTSVAVGLTMVDSEVSFAGDDLFAVHCELGVAWGVPGSQSGGGGRAGSGSSSLWVVDTGGPTARTIANTPVGSTLTFWALNATMDPLGAGVVAAVSVVDNATLQEQASMAPEYIARERHVVVRNFSSAALLVRVDFTAPLPDAVLPRFAAMVQSDATCGFGTTVVNSSLHDGTGGMRLKGFNVTVAGNTLARAYGMTMVPGVFWTQSTSANVTIVDNVFETTGGAPAVPDPISYAPDTCPGLTLRNNTFLP